MEDIYISQDRGNEKEYQQYLDAMDAVSIEKVASASVFFEPLEGNVLVDVGMASGTSSAILAQLFPKLSIIGVDINPKMVDMAQDKYRLPNLSFRVDDGEKLAGFENNSVNGFFNCSSIHHITSFNGYDSNRAYSTIACQTKLLKERGIIVIRDFVKPGNREVMLELSTADKSDRPNDCELLLNFAQAARSLAVAGERGFPVKELSQKSKDRRRFRLFYADAVEFVRRKDYYENWDVELQEEYGYFTQQEFEDCFRNNGLRIILSSPIYNPWIIANRYRGQFCLYDLNGEMLGFPPTNYLIAGEKTEKGGKKIFPVRYLPESDKPFLKFSAYLNTQNHQVYDLVERPNEVVDLIPYYRNGDKIEILAKHAYPRPLVNAETDSAIIDGKYYGGYLTEGITASKTGDIATILHERTGIGTEDCLSTDISLNYYTSPGGINEKVSSYLVQLSHSPDDSVMFANKYPGLNEWSVIRKYDAEQLLKTAQTGTLAEARLELNIYHLFRKKQILLPKWMGEKIEIGKDNIPEITRFDELIGRQAKCFEPAINTSSFLTTQRVLFAESGPESGKNVLEYVYPSSVSSNTLITLPVCNYSDKVYIGLELRDLPVPQILSGNSTIITVPARRLLKEITNFQMLEEYILQMDLFGSKVTRFSKLGEKYFPSVGVTPEQVYPYMVQTDIPAKDLAWVELDTLINHAEQLHDGHLLISLFRLWHALHG
jgi:SAM-dependent methyltransferase